MKTIAVIEDNQHIGDIPEINLKQEGYRVLRAHSGEDGTILFSKQFFINHLCNLAKSYDRI